MNRRKNILIAVLLLVLAACGCVDVQQANSQEGPPKPKKGASMQSDKEQKFEFTLSEGNEGGGAAESTAKAAVSPIDAGRREALLQRLPALPEADTLKKDFNRRVSSRPAPRGGTEVKIPFPPPGEIPELAEAKLVEAENSAPAVLERWSPMRDVPTAQAISLTFSKPMTELQDVSGANAKIPAEIKPAIAGRWRWLGTKTAVFEPEIHRLPMSEAYTVSVPATLTDAMGKTIAKPASFSFETDRLKIVRSHPGYRTDLSPICYMVFNQKIDPEKIFSSIELRLADASPAGILTGRKDAIPIERLTYAQLPKDSSEAAALKELPETQWVAFKPSVKLTPATRYYMVLRKGAPSAEGSLTTSYEQSTGFNTYDPLKITGTNADRSWTQNKLGVGEKIEIYFNNTLDAEVCPGSKATVSISPKVSSFNSSISGSTLVIAGDMLPETTYTVEVSSSATDIYGQTLGRNQRLKFTYGEIEPFISTPGNTYAIIDPSGARAYSVCSSGLSDFEVRLYKVSEEDYRQYLLDEEHRERRYIDSIDKYKVYGTKVYAKKIKPSGSKNEISQTPIDLSGAYDKDGLGLAMLLLQAQKGSYKYHRCIWLQSTKLCLDTIADHDKGIAVVSDLESGRPVEGAEVRYGDYTGKSDSRGIVDIRPNGSYGEDNGVIPFSARLGNDFVFAGTGSRSVFNSNPRSERMLWKIFDDRGLYRPKETVHVKGWLRRVAYGQDTETELDSSAKDIVWSLRDARGAEITKGTTGVSNCGGFEITFDLPDDINLGNARLSVSCGGYAINHSFNVQEFRRPEFEVSSSVEGSDHVMGGFALVNAKASYFSGGVVSNAPITWRVNATASRYSPPGWSGFSFVEDLPWWYDFGGFGGEENVSHELGLTTDSLGKSCLRIDMGDCLPPRPYALSVSSSVSDVNNQTWSSSSSLLAHPSAVYVGVKSSKQYVPANGRPKMEFIVTGISGKAKAGCKINLHWGRLDTRVSDNDDKITETDVFEESCISASEPVKREVSFPRPGVWRLKASTSDAEGRQAMTVFSICVGDFASVNFDQNKVSMESLTLVPDQKEYEAGQTAEVLVQSPFKGACMVYALGRQGLIKTETVPMDGTSAKIRVPLDEKWIPGVSLKVCVYGSAERLDGDGNKIPGTLRPACASKDLTLNISKASKTLQVEAVPADKDMEPGHSSSVSVTVRDYKGNPVPDAETAVFVVDDSVWALGGYSISSPVDAFYPSRSADVNSNFLRLRVLLNSRFNSLKDLENHIRARRDMMYDCVESTACEAGAAPMGIAMGAPKMMMKNAGMAASAPRMKGGAQSVQENSNAPIAMRSNFNPLAVFEGRVITGADGKAKVSFKLPDNLTRYRVVAVAADKKSRFGKGESSITARLPLMVRPSAPRFLNFGDKFSLPVVLHNQTSSPMRIDLAARASNLKVAAPGGAVCEIPAKSRREVLLPMETEQAGQAVVQIAAASGSFADSAECKMPVYTPCTTEGFATYGTTDKEEALIQPMKRPADAFTQFGGLDVSTSSTALQELTDAVIYLCDYPFSCSEQIASRMIVLSQLHDVLREFNVKQLPGDQAVRDSIAADLKELSKRQSYSGGFGLWLEGKLEMPYVSVHCAQAMTALKAKGFSVPSDMFERSLGYLESIDRHIPKDYSEMSRLNVYAYADNVLHQNGKLGSSLPGHIALLKKKDFNTISVDILGWYLPVAVKIGDAELAKNIRTAIGSRISETAGKASIGTYGQEDAYLILYSSMRSEAVVLSALIDDQPNNTVIPKLVRSILDGRRRGHWGETQSNAMVVMALNKYFRTFENVVPDFTANIWLGSEFVGAHTYKGRQAVTTTSSVPMNMIPESSRVILDKQGQGRLYYRLGLSYALKDLAPKPYEAGFAVERTYEGVDDPKDVKQIDASTWEFKLGSRIRCTTRLVAPARRGHVALVVPIPAGCEILNSGLKMTEPVPSSNSSDLRPLRCGWWWYFSSPFDHENLRDERAETFSLMLPGGSYDYSFVCRACAPGTFVVPPAKAEEMYAPEVFGRSGGIKVIIR